MLPALILGLAGSLHCVGMCGPIVLALPLKGGAGTYLLRQMLVYHIGRILTYTAIGAFFGLMGQGLMLAGMQKVLALGAGLAIILLALASWRFERLVTALPGLQSLTRQVQRRMNRLLRTHPVGYTFSMGLLNGLLPCGLVYAALAGAIASGGVMNGALFMSTFGLGTLPLLLSATLFGRYFSKNLRSRFRLVQPVLLVLAGVLLIQRGLHLDLSLFQSAVPPAQLDCH